MEASDAMAVKDEHVRNLLRQVVQQKGRPVRFEERDSYEYPGEKEVSIYGWVDDNADDHMRHSECTWQIAPDARLVERTYVVFGDTFNGNDDEIGINVSPASCTCGEYQNMHLRYTESFGNVLREVLKVDDGIQI